MNALFGLKPLEDNCCVCQEPMAEPGLLPKIFGAPRITTLECAHKMHKCCVQKWADAQLEKTGKSEGDIPCPNCRTMVKQEHIGKKLMRCVKVVAQIYGIVVTLASFLGAGVILDRLGYAGATWQTVAILAGAFFVNVALLKLSFMVHWNPAKWAFNIYTGYSATVVDIHRNKKATLPNGIERLYNLLFKLKPAAQMPIDCKTKEVIIQEAEKLILDNYPDFGVKIKNRFNIAICDANENISNSQEFAYFLLDMGGIFAEVEPKLGEVIATNLFNKYGLEYPSSEDEEDGLSGDEELAV